MHLFNEVSQKCSKITTQQYSTSFSSAIKLLHKNLQQHIHNIYGFVRFADEIVDTFHDHDKAILLAEFKHETYMAIDRQISLNPILHSFQYTVNYYNIDPQLINNFFCSMELDLSKREYDRNSYCEYIYGSAEAVGLMCLYVFCEGDMNCYEQLKTYAQSLGAAFQKYLPFDVRSAQSARRAWRRVSRHVPEPVNPRTAHLLYSIPMPILRLDHINVSGSAELLARCRTFYVEVLGLTDGPRPPFRSRGFWLYAGDAPLVHLTERADAATGATGSFDHFAFACGDFDGTVERLTRHAVPFTVDGVPATGRRQVFLHDPAGVAIELNFH